MTPRETMASLLHEHGAPRPPKGALAKIEAAAWKAGTKTKARDQMTPTEMSAQDGLLALAASMRGLMDVEREWPKKRRKGPR